ncbi:MAG: type II secretion system F family protein [Acidimicrobiia bacterium]
MSLPSDPIVLLLLVGVVVSVGAIVLVVMSLGAERQRAMADAAAEAAVTTRRRSDRRTRRLDDALDASPTLRRAVALTANLANRKGALGSAERLLRAADVPVRPAEMILAHVSAAVALPAFVLLVTQSPGNALFAFVFALLGPPFGLKTFVKLRRKKFQNQLPDALITLAGSLRAGRSLGQAMEALAREAPDPMGRELRKVVAEVRLGRPLHDTLADAAERIDSADFKWAVLAMQIQAEVGGNLAELLDQVANTMRERTRMRGEVKALTAEGRASALMLVVMVPALGGVMAVMNPEYMEPMFTTGAGKVMLGICAVMIGGGYLWMSRMVKIEV